MTKNITQEYRNFTETAKEKMYTINGVEWKYYVLGAGSETFLLLTGGGSIPEASFLYANSLSKKYRVIIPAIPEVFTMDACVEGVNGILIKENITKTHFLGFSMGGMISQCFVRKYPSKVSNLVFFVSMLPSKTYAKKYSKYKRGISIVPEWLFKWISKRSLKKQVMLDKDKSSPEVTSFWVNFFDWEFDSGKMNKKLLLATTDILIDYFSQYNFTEHDLDEWNGKILLVESDKDATIVTEERERFRKVYHRAKVITQKDSGHFGEALLNPGNLIEEIGKFVD